MDAKRARDLLLPGVAYYEAQFASRVAGDIEITQGGNLSLKLTANNRTAYVQLASPDTLENEQFKATFDPITRSAFEAFDQALHPDAPPPSLS